MPSDRPNSPTTDSKTTLETVVATAFPELVNMSDSSFLDHWNSTDYSIDEDLGDAYSDQYFVDDDDDDDDVHLNISSAPSHLDSSIYTSAGEDTNDLETSKDFTSPFNSPSKYTDRIFVVSPSPTAANTTVTAHSEWWTPRAQAKPEITLDCGNTERNEDNDRKQKRTPPLRLAMWEKILIIVVLLGVIACVFVAVVITLDQTTGIGKLASIWPGKNLEPSTTAAPSMGPRAPAYNISDHSEDRFTVIGAWLNMENATPGTYQHDALLWLAHADLPHILGPLPSKQAYDITAGLETLHPNVTVDGDTGSIAEVEAFLQRLAQRFALLVLYFAVMEAGGGVPAGGWASITGARLNECLWPGVICSDKGQYVSGLEIDPNVGFLQGSLPSELGLLSNLGKSTQRH
jgi:hypothetical protein